MLSLSGRRRPFSSLHRLLAVGGAMVLVLLSCGREQATGPMRTPGGVARGLSFNAIFPAMPNIAAFALVIDFTRVRVLLHHADGSVALDTLVAFPAGADAITLSFDVSLAPGTPAAGELLALTLAYINAAGDTVFRGGPVELRAAAAIEGAPPPPPVSIPVVYSGPGASAKTIKIAPRTLTVNAGAPFAYSALAMDAAGATVSAAPVGWVTPDPTIATIPVPSVGSGTANASRGTARIIAQLINGAADTVALNVIPAATTVAVASGNNQSGLIGKPVPQALAQPIAVRVTAGDGLGVGGVTVTFAAANGGAVGATSVITDAAGLAQTTWSLGTSGTAQTATAAVASLAGSPVTFNATGTAKPATKLVLTSGPAAGANIPAGSPATLAVAAQDVDGDLALGFTGDVTVALTTNPAEATLAGTATVAAVSGVATFTTLSITTPGIGYVLQASSGALTPVSTNAFNIVSGAAAKITLASGGSQAGAPGKALSAPVVLKVMDASGNPVSGTPVSFAVASGGGSVGTPSATTDANGLASTSWTLGASGTQTMTGSSTGLTGSPITISATLAAGAGTTTVTPRNDTLTSLGATQALSAVLRDGAGNVVTTSFSWVSRDASIATVSSGGVITAVTNGSTYVVASEIGGTRDSALVVVQQRTASVNITPGSRSLYPTGTFAYSALAVDGRGNAMATQPTFTWSSTSPTIATVDASTGAVTAVSLGNTQIRATAGSIIGVSALSVLTPIKRILVGFDTEGPVTVPDTFTMTALGLRRGYRAEARDTLDAPMSGITFTWNSTNASVAAIDAPQATTAGAISAANGVTSVQASAQGVTGSATLYVAQVLTSIELTPTAASVNINGSTALLARGKDSQNRYISGGSYTYTSSGPTFATVGATTGVVTGKAYGTANITATSGTITSNTAVITISNTGVPAVISFGRDTIGVGRGTSVSVPILLTTPSASPLVVTLAAVDTNAYWSTATITIPTGATSVNATLNGRNAGTTRVSAIDATATYNGDTAVVAVQANMRLTTTYYSMNQTDQQATQVLLSDPSPAGGTYVTFSYGTAGKAEVSPDPAFIPAGQLAADIVIRGIGAGTTTVTPLATGVSGAGASVTVSAAVLNMPYGTLRLGAGQYEAYMYVQVPNYVTSPLVIAMTSTDSSVATTAPSLTIPTSNYYKYFEVDGRAPGTSSIIASATGWTPDTLYVTTTTPKLSLCCTNTLNSTSPAQSLSIYTADSVGTAHARVSSLSIRVTSSDTTVLKVLDTLVTVTAGAYYSSTARVIPNGTGGTAWIYVTAGGHLPDSVKFTVVGPSLSFGSTTSRVGVGQVDDNQYITIPNAISKPLVITLTNSDSTYAATNPTVTIPPGQAYAYFPVRGRGVGTSGIIASAAGYVSDTLSEVVTSPILRAISSGSLNAYSTYAANVYVGDTVGNYHNRITDLTVSIRSSDPSILSVDTAAVIPAGYYYVPGSVVLKAVNPGTVKIYFTAPGHAPDSSTFTVVPAKVSLSWDAYQIGARQRQPSAVYAYIPNSRDVSVPLTLTHSNPAAVSLSTTTPTIPANTNYIYFDFAGLTNGVDTVIVTASGYLPDTAYIRVSTPRFLIGSFPTSGTTTNPAASVLLYVADSSGTVHYANDTVVVHAVSSDSTIVKPVAEYFRILKDTYYSYTGYQFVGPGTATITYSDSAASAYKPVTSSPVIVTGPSLYLGGSPGMLGTGQHTFPSTYYVSMPNSIGAPLTVNLISTDPRVATVPATVVIPAGQTSSYFTITAQDTIGTVQIQATATGYTASSTNMQVTQSKLVLGTPTSVVTTTPPNYIVVYAEDANGNVHPVNADLVVTLLSSQPGVASIDSTSVTIVKDQYYSNTATWTPASVGTAQLSASDNRAIRYPAVQSTANVTVNTPAASLGFATMSLGIGQYLDTYTSVPNTTTAPLDVLLTHAATPTTTTPASVTIPKSSYYQYFRITGTSVGTDTITASPPGHTPAVGTVKVDKGLIGGVSGWPSTLKVGDSTLVTVYLRSPDGSTGRLIAAATTFGLAADANATFTLGGANATPITSYVVPADGSYLQFYIKAASTGTATITVSNATYISYVNSVSVTP